MSQSKLFQFAQRVAAYIVGMPENAAVLGAENEGFFVQQRNPGELIKPQDYRRINVWVRNGKITQAIVG